MKKLTFSLALLLIALALSATLVSAATSPTPTETEIPEPTKSNDEKTSELLKKAAVKGVTSDDETKRGFMGTVKRVSEEALTVETRHGTEIITLNPEISILQDNKAFAVKNIEIDSQLVIMGYQDGEDFNAKRILVLKKPLQSAKKTVWVGSIKKMEKVTGNNFVAFTIQTRSNEEKNFSLNNKTAIEDDSGITIKSTDLDTDQEVLLITVPEDATSQSVKDSSGKILRIHSLVPSDATPVPNKTSPTATPKSSGPTKKPTATPKE